MKIHNCVKFHLYSICGCQVINFPMFLLQCSIHEMALFGGFLGPNCLKYCLILLKLAPEVVFKERKTVFSKIFGKFKFLRKLHVTKVCTFFQFLPNFDPFYSMKEAEIEKT